MLPHLQMDDDDSALAGPSPRLPGIVTGALSRVSGRDERAFV
jgi:hypothetical protein